MESTVNLKIKMTREQKDVLDNASEIFKEIYDILKDNRERGFTPFQDNLEIYDEFWKIYTTCLGIQAEQLIP